MQYYDKFLSLQDGEAYAHLLSVLAPELGTTTALDTKDPLQRASLIVEQAEKMDCKRYVTAQDIVEGSTNLNLAFVAQIFQHRLDFLLLCSHMCKRLICLSSLEHLEVIPDCA